jgi:predicted MFS family arabinose efflux permease
MPTSPQSGTPPRYVLLILTLVFAFSFLDRVIFNVLLEPIRREFDLSDTVMGLLSGFAFVAFYTLLSFPVSRWADRGDRRTIVSLGLVLWSAMTTFSGLVTSVTQLALARIFVGVGESTGSAPVHSLLSDYFPKEKRTRAFGVFSGGLHVGVLLGYLIGGLVGQALGWRAAFFVAGVPGLLLALLLRLTVQEPVRGQVDAAAVERVPESLGKSIRQLFRSRTYRLVVLGGTLGAIVVYALNTWEATFLRRLHGFDGRQIGLVAGVIKGLAGLGGALLGGYLVQRFSRVDERNVLRFPAYATGLAGGLLLLFLFGTSTPLALVGLGGFTFLIAVHIGVLWGVAQTVSPVRHRALAAAVLTSSSNLIGHSLGSSVPGILNDVLKPSYGDEAIRYSLLVAGGVAVLTGFVLWRAATSVATDARRALETTQLPQA